MDYALLKVDVPQEWREIMIAELSFLGFDMMEEKEEGIEAVIEADRKSGVDLSDIVDRYSHIQGFKLEWTELETVNWNEEWEKNYDPVRVEDKVLIRADFHSPDPSIPYEILINPRMSFGTGHHATTWLMAKGMLELNLEGKTILDAGCGTGILAILAKMLKAGNVEAYDISQLCVDNTVENAEANQVNFPVYTCTIRELPGDKKYNVILANINKNALLDEMEAFSERLTSGGILLLSGFFEKDLNDLEKQGARFGLVKNKVLTRNDWAMLELSKSALA